MSATYQLACDCGQRHAVETAQAGQQLTCSCGRVLEIPTLRGLRQLEPVVAEAGQTSVGRVRKWSPAQGLCFVTGLGLLVAALLFAGYLQLNRMALDTRETKWDSLEEDLAKIDAFAAADAWDAWTQVRNEKLVERTLPQFILARRAARRLGLMIVFVLGVAALGLGIAALSFVLPGKQPPPTAARRPATARKR